MSNRKLILYIAASLDGYIAKPNDDLSFLDSMHVEGEDYGYENFISGVDTVILGRKTYDWVMSKVDEFPHADKETYVITRTVKAKNKNISFYNGDLNELISTLKEKDGKNIFCDGGAEIVNELLKQRLFDELIISIVPIILGDRTRLFKNGIPEQELILLSSKSFQTGLVQLHYQLK